MSHPGLWLNEPTKRCRRSSLRLFWVLALCGVLLPVAGDAQAQGTKSKKDFPGIEALMDEGEFSEAGLGKLSQDELKNLNDWLLRYTAGEAKVLQQKNTAVREAKKNLEVVSRISGDFSGWTGSTVFKLENGQVWQQRLDGRYRYRGEANPEVRISKNWMGFYRMELIGRKKAIGVTRVQ
ncbi:MAG: hypothetical protein AAGI88_16640 [Pseudomonadota bacterium]